MNAELWKTNLIGDIRNQIDVLTGSRIMKNENLKILCRVNVGLPYQNIETLHCKLQIVLSQQRAYKSDVFALIYLLKLYSLLSCENFNKEKAIICGSLIATLKEKIRVLELAKILQENLFRISKSLNDINFAIDFIKQLQNELGISLCLRSFYEKFFDFMPGKDEKLNLFAVEIVTFCRHTQNSYIEAVFEILYEKFVEEYLPGMNPGIVRRNSKKDTELAVNLLKSLELQSEKCLSRIEKLSQFQVFYPISPFTFQKYVFLIEEPVVKSEGPPIEHSLEIPLSTYKEKNVIIEFHLLKEKAGPELTCKVISTDKESNLKPYIEGGSRLQSFRADLNFPKFHKQVLVKSESNYKYHLTTSFYLPIRNKLPENIVLENFFQIIGDLLSLSKMDLYVYPLRLKHFGLISEKLLIVDFTEFFDCKEFNSKLENLLPEPDFYNLRENESFLMSRRSSQICITESNASFSNEFSSSINLFLAKLEKYELYSFGILALQLITGRPVRIVRKSLEKVQDQELQNYIYRLVSGCSFNGIYSELSERSTIVNSSLR